MLAVMPVNPLKHGLIVYGLIDPRTDQLRYIGKSTSGIARPRAHLTPSALRETTRKANWLKGLLALGLEPEIEILERHAEHSQLVEAEQFWIAYFKAIGCNLTNLTQGGDGNIGWVPSPAVRAKIAAATANRKVSEKHRAALRLRGRSPEMLERLSKMTDSNRGRPLTQRQRDALDRARHAQLGKKRGAYSAEHRAAIAAGRGVEPFILDGRRFSSIREAAGVLGVSRHRVAAAIARCAP